MRLVFRLLPFLVLTLAFGCTQPGVNAGAGQAVLDGADWRGIPLTDASTGKSFAISDFKGRIVVLETMAVWCPTCVRQQIEVQGLQSTFGNEVVSIVLDIDKNEDEAILRRHVQTHGFGQGFAVSPPTLSRALEQEFGNVVLNPPSTPVIILDREQKGHALRPGLKDTGELAKEVQKLL